jgi:hypothetical protein
MNDKELATDLTVADLKTISALIEACTVRGVFKAQELSIIGIVYDKINGILKSLANEDNRN